MNTAQRAYINNSVLLWARKSSKISKLSASKRAGVSIQSLESWEEGKTLPTIRQAKLLAKYYRRPLAVLYLTEPPKDFQTLRDFRKEYDGELSTALVFMIREVQMRQYWIKNYFNEIKISKLPFIGKFNISSNINEVAEDIIKTIGYIKPSSSTNLLKDWTKRIEEKRIFISQASNIHSHLPLGVDEVRGFTISDNIAPFIFINSRDSKTANLFTLFHELAHLWINEDGISNLNYLNFRENNQDTYDPIEVFCNRVAAEILMPHENIIESAKSSNEINKETIERIARKFGVSRLALSTRFLNLGLISKRSYNSLRSVFIDDWEKYLARQKKKLKDSKGYPPHNLLKFKRNGREFSNIIISNFRNGLLTGRETSNLLDIKINSIPKYEEYLYKR